MADNPADGVVLGLDIGHVRIGVAACRTSARFPAPLTTIPFDDSRFEDDILSLVTSQGCVMVVVGWPRGMQGQATAQTGYVEALVDRLKLVLGVPVYLQDEALTSRRAEEELEARKKPFSKEDVDALAATYILEDFVTSAAFDAAQHARKGAHHV